MRGRWIDRGGGPWRPALWLSTGLSSGLLVGYLRGRRRAEAHHSAASAVSGIDKATLGVLVEQASDVILVLDDDDLIEYASPSARGLFGTSILIGRRFPDLVLADERRAAQFFLKHARENDADHQTKGANHSGGRADLTIEAVDGRQCRAEVSCRDLRAHDPVQGLVVTLRDVTGQRWLERELTRQAFRDQLTGLPNRLSFRDRVTRAIACPTGLSAVFLLDLDHFRAVNEALGRDVGDAVLKGVAERLCEAAGAHHLTARLSGDEFGVLLDNGSGPAAVDRLAHRLHHALVEPIRVGADAIACGASMGVATTASAETDSELLRHADLALVAAKAGARGRWRRYEPSMTHAVRFRTELRSALGDALRQGSLVVEYQPIIGLGDGLPVGFEALVRWRHPQLGLLSPNAFIDVAEESGLIIPIGEHVLRSALAAALTWDHWASRDPPYVSVNVSVRQFRVAGFVDTVHRLLRESGLPPARLVLEITESLLLHDDDAVWEDLKRLRMSGIRIAIDDFGTGYSALSYLRQVPLDIVKLDRMFVHTMVTSHRQRELVRGIIGLIRTLRLECVAEGIETSYQRDLAARLGCAHGQGYLFARPMPEVDATRWLTRATG